MAKNKQKKQLSKKETSPVLESKSTASRRTFLIATLGVLTVGAGAAIWSTSRNTVKSKYLSKEGTVVYFEEKIKSYSPAIRKFFKEFIDPQTAYKLDRCDSLIEGSVIATKMLDESYSRALIDSYLDKCRSWVEKEPWGGQPFAACNTDKKLGILSTVLFKDMGISYEHDLRVIEPYLFSTLVKTNKGNCATMPLLYAMLAEAYEMPVTVSYIGSHMFARYDSKIQDNRDLGKYNYSSNQKTYINIECTNNKGTGVGVTDEVYLSEENRQLKKEGKPSIPVNLIQYGAYLRSLSRRESIGAVFANQAHYSSQKDRKNTMKFLAYAFYLNDRDYGMITNIQQEMKRIATYMTKAQYEQLYRELIDHINTRFKSSFSVVERRRKRPTSGIDNDPLYYHKKFKKEQQQFMEDQRRKQQEKK